MTRTAAALARDRELANARQRAYLERKNTCRVVSIDDLECQCWCEKAIIRIPRAFVLDGRTDTCGRPDCTEEAA